MKKRKKQKNPKPVRKKTMSVGLLTDTIDLIDNTENELLRSQDTVYGKASAIIEDYAKKLRSGEV